MASILLTVSCWLAPRETSYLPRCELPSAEAHIAKKWGWPQANSQEGVEALIPIGRRKRILPTAMCRSLAANPPALSLEMTAALIRWSQPGRTLDQTPPGKPGSEPDQRDWVINACCFKATEFWGNLLWSNTTMNWGIQIAQDWTAEVQKKKKKILCSKQYLSGVTDNIPS